MIVGVVVAIVVVNLLAAIVGHGSGPSGFPPVTSVVPSPATDYTLGSASAVAIPASSSDDGSLVPVVVTNRDSGDAGHPTFDYLSGRGSQPIQRWSFAGLAGDAATQVQSFTADDTVFLVTVNGVNALGRADGRQRWQRSMTTAGTQFVAADSTLVSLDGTGMLSGYRGDRPDPSWTRRVASGQQLRLVDPGIVLLVADARPGAGPVVARIDPATGAELSAARPDCSAAGAPSAVVGDVVSLPYSKVLVALAGAVPTCAFRWDSASGVVAWVKRLDPATAAGGSATVAFGDHAAMVDRAGHLVLMDLQSGSTKVADAPPGWSVEPRWMGRDVVVAAAVTSSDGVRSELQAYDLASGALRWRRRAVAASQPIGSVRAITDVATVRATAGLAPRWEVGGGTDNVRLFTIASDLRSVTVESLDPATGATTATAQVRIGSHQSVGRVRELVRTRRGDAIAIGDALVVLAFGEGYQSAAYPPG